MRGLFSWETEYSALPMTSGSAAVLPATRTPNSWPRPWSKTSSGGTRESEQPTIAANGDCPSTSWARRAETLLCPFVLPVTKRRLPSWSAFSAAAGDSGEELTGAAPAWSVMPTTARVPAAAKPDARNVRREVRGEAMATL